MTSDCLAKHFYDRRVRVASFSRSLDEKVFIVLISNVVAVMIALRIMDQGLEVEVRKLVHDAEHDVLKELVI